MRRHKKGSLELSVNAIIIVVLAMTLLGLGLGFIRGMFQNIGETTTQVQEQVKAQILEDLRTGNKKLSFPTSSLIVEKGSYKDIAIGVKNTNAENELQFKIIFNITQRQEGPVLEGGVEAPLEEQIVFFYAQGPYTLRVTEAEAYPIRVSAKGAKGTYLANIVIQDVSGATPVTFAEKTFFINMI